MAELDIKTPAIIKIANGSDRAVAFVPYRENFVTVLPAGKTLEFTVKHSGQVLYYLGQATKGLTVEVIEALDAASEDIIVLNTPATITIANVSDKVQTFVPYKENFMHEVAVGDSVKLDVETVGQVLYYLAQAIKDTLTVTQEADA